MAHTHHPLALVTAASSGIGLQLAHQCVGAGFDLLIAADRPLDFAMKVLTDRGAAVEAIEADLSTAQGVDKLLARLVDRRVDVLLANADPGQGQDAHDVDPHISSKLHLIRSIARSMGNRGQGKILLTGSIAGLMPRGFEAAYNRTKAVIDSFCRTLRKELKGSGVTVSCLTPRVNDTRFFARADLMQNKTKTSDFRVDLVDVARIGFKAMIDGEGVTPASVETKQRRKMADPDARRSRGRPVPPASA